MFDERRRRLLLGGTSLAMLGMLPRAAAADATDTVHGYPFALGVASGSPLPDAVVIWTRIVFDPLNAAATPPLALAVRWEMAHDEAFTQLAAKGVASATPALGHSVHIDVTGLVPGRWYWYRFMLGDAVSPVGRTRTAPAPDSRPEALKLVVASCQHWEFGTYAAHHHIAAAAPELVLFLGDYIYEWGPYQLQHPVKPVRTAESFTLAEYRARYTQYKSDPLLQEAHRVAPWIVTWDDHEVANDYGNDRDERLSPDFLQRRAAAYQAFYEHMPVRLQMGPHGFAQMRIYQRYDWGRLARFHVLDDRQYRSYHACPRPGRGGSNVVDVRDCPALLDPSRTMLGAPQQSWLEAGLNGSPARWNVLMQQTLMAQASQVPLTQPGDGRYWTDGWDGYPMARQRLLELVELSRARNPLVLSGDVHSFFATELCRNPMRAGAADNPIVATELCGTSITSPSRPQERTDQMVALNPHIKYGRSDKRGYMLVDMTRARTTALFQALDDVQNAKSGQSTLARFTIEEGKPGLLRT